MRRYGIIGLFGDREQGKTTYMVKHLIKELDSGVHYDQAFCNIKVKDKRVRLINYEGLKKLKQPAPNGIPRTVVALDQIHKYFDSRQSNSKRNVEFSEIMTESRQHGFDVIYTTWARSMVDKRLRPFTPLFILSHMPSSRRGFKYEFIERDNPVLGQYRYMPWTMAAEVWRKFDSTELIEDPTIPK